jgi:hypothetical protein
MVDQNDISNFQSINKKELQINNSNEEKANSNNILEYKETKRKNSFDSNRTNSPISRKNSSSSEDNKINLNIESKQQINNKLRYENENLTIIVEKHEDSPDSPKKHLVKENKPTLIFDILRRKSMQVKQIFKENHNPDSFNGSRRDSKKDYSKEVVKRTKQCFSSKNVSTRPLVSINNSVSKDPHFPSNHKVIEDASSTSDDKFSSSNSFAYGKEDCADKKNKEVENVSESLIKSSLIEKENLNKNIIQTQGTALRSKPQFIKDSDEVDYEEEKDNQINTNKYENVNKNIIVQSNKIKTKSNYSPINENNYYESGSEGFESC